MQPFPKDRKRRRFIIYGSPLRLPPQEKDIPYRGQVNLASDGYGSSCQQRQRDLQEAGSDDAQTGPFQPLSGRVPLSGLSSPSSRTNAVDCQPMQGLHVLASQYRPLMHRSGCAGVIGCRGGPYLLGSRRDERLSRSAVKRLGEALGTCTQTDEAG